MKLTMVRYKVKADRVAENEALLAKVFEATAKAKPAGIHYASFKLEDGVTFVALVHLDEKVNPNGNPLLELPEFKEFQANIADRCEVMPATEVLTSVGAYQFFDEA
jgi:hypothetical protein